MPTISTLGFRLAAPLLFLAFTGCADDSITKDNLPRKAITGTVTLDGQPLATGKIQFDPAEVGKGPNTAAVADVNDGKYSIEQASGPVPGKYKIQISSRPSIKIAADEIPGGRPKMEPEKVPAQYNSKSTLLKDVTDQSVNTFDFDLKSK